MILATLSCLILGGVSIELPSASTSEGLEISVAEVAKVTGDDPALVARVAAASLGYAPAPGYHRTLRADLILATLRQALPGVDIDVKGAPRCHVTPAIAVVSGADILASAAETLRASLNGMDSSSTPSGKISDVQVPSSSEKPRIVVPPINGSTMPGVRTVPVQIWIGDQLYRTLSPTFQVNIWQRRAVLKRAVDAGQSLHAGLFEIKRVPVDGTKGMHALAMDELGGAVALNPLPAGTSIHERDVHRQVVVRRGDHVTVRVVKGTVAVSDVAIAQNDGRMGERVRVVLRSTGRELQGVVRGAQSIEVKIQ